MRHCCCLHLPLLLVYLSPALLSVAFDKPGMSH
jgi:hypothetical protein